MPGSFVAGAATAAANWRSLPLVFGIMAFVYSGHGVFPSIQRSMKEPSRFPQARLSLSTSLECGSTLGFAERGQQEYRNPKWSIRERVHTCDKYPLYPNK